MPKDDEKFGASQVQNDSEELKSSSPEEIKLLSNIEEGNEEGKNFFHEFWPKLLQVFLFPCI